MIPLEEWKRIRCFCSNEIIKDRKLLVKNGSDFFFFPIFLFCFYKNWSCSFAISCHLCKHLILPSFFFRSVFVAVIANLYILFCNNKFPRSKVCKFSDLKGQRNSAVLSELLGLRLTCVSKALRLASAEKR